MAAVDTAPRDVTVILPVPTPRAFRVPGLVAAGPCVAPRSSSLRPQVVAVAVVEPRSSVRPMMPSLVTRFPSRALAVVAVEVPFAYLLPDPSPLEVAPSSVAVVVRAVARISDPVLAVAVVVDPSISTQRVSS